VERRDEEKTINRKGRKELRTKGAKKNKSSKENFEERILTQSNTER
jgi:hypothetical protein